MDEDEPGELVDGRLEEEEEPDLIHDMILIWLGQILSTWLGGAGNCRGTGCQIRDSIESWP